MRACHMTHIVSINWAHAGAPNYQINFSPLIVEYHSPSSQCSHSLHQAKAERS